MLNERDAPAGEATEEPGNRRFVLKASLATLAAVGSGAFSTLAQAQATPISGHRTRIEPRNRMP